MTRIQRLPTSVVNKIAAGEVIERPASVVKELLENSVDAGATCIEVWVEQGGIDLIRIVDDGHGIAGDQLELAATSHATSKILDAEDLFSVETLGFRGEALASIAEVSQMTLRSRVPEHESAFELRINGGVREPIAPCAAGVGTSIEVANLFFNTPVRRKFLRTTQTEMGHINEAFSRIALAYPNLRMSLSHNGRTIHDLTPTDSWAQRVEGFFGEEIAESLIPISSRDGDVTIRGFVVNPTQSRGHNRMQYLFLNGRFIRDRALQHALGEAYRGLLLTGRFPIAFLRLDMPPELVDVNVHPAKLEVRFQEGSRLYSQLLGSLRNKFLTTDLTAHESLRAPRQPVAAHTPAGAPSIDFSPAAPDAQSPHPGITEQDRLRWPSERSQVDWTRRPTESLGITPPRQVDPQDAHDSTTDVTPTPPGVPSASSGSRAMQVHNRYLITESDEGVVVIDQHALHERIIYEQLREKVLSSQLESQRLLVPEPVPLAPSEASRILESQEVLSKIGIAVEAFGGDTILVSAYPAMLANQNPAEMLRSVLELLLSGGKDPEARDVVDELLHMISCKAAVKAGDQLSEEEITALLEHRQLCQDAHHCPHGRPTSLVFSREELDRRFKRI